LEDTAKTREQLLAELAECRRRLEETRQLSTAIEQTAEGVFITDPQGTIVYVNPAFEHTSGYSRHEAIGQRPSILQSGEHDAAYFQELWSVIRAGNVWHGRFINKRKDGTRYTADTTISPVRGEAGGIVAYVCLQRDVTRELQMDQQYRQLQKMDAMGQLTAGVAHDFNNLLTAINGFAELLQLQSRPGDAAHDMAGKILDAGRHGADLVHQLLTFSRKQVVRPQLVDLNQIVADMGKMLPRIIGEHIDLTTSPAPDLWPVKVDRAQVEQVIVNLAVNARDAMPDGGKLTIETANVVLDQGYVAAHLQAEPGDHVLLAVSDTGVGMTPEVKAHLFEPFFTTKEHGQGTGLGLATVYGIVKQSGGNIWVYSEEGVGTTFKIYLPRTRETAPAARPSQPDDRVPFGNETILLVEDNAGVRDLARLLLQRQGYTVLAAEDGAQALRMAERHSGSINLVLSDLVLPGMSGVSLSEQLSRRRPNLRTLFMSGYTEKAVAHHNTPGSGSAFLQKPFSSLELARKVRSILDRH